MRGNSLLEQYNGFDLSTIMHSKKKVEGPVQMTFFEDNVDVLRRQVIGLRRSYYRETNKKEKKNLRTRMREIVQQQINTLSYNIDLSGIDIADNSEFFLWHTWFADVFENGGFDIVIGNPPYVTYKGKQKVEISETILKQMVERFQKSAEYKINSYALFIEQGIDICKENGVASYIIPSTLLQNEYLSKIRKMLLNESQIINIVSFENKVFDAVTDSIICTTLKGKSNRKLHFMRVSDLKFTTSDDRLLNQDVWNNEEKKYVIDTKTSERDSELFCKMENISVPLGNLYKVYVGIVANGIKKFLHDSKVNSYCKKYIQGKHIDHYQIKYDNVFIEFIKSLLHSNTDEDVYELDRKILVRKTGNILIATIDEEQYYTDQSIYNVYQKKKGSYNDYITTAILNSKLMNYYFNKKLITNADVFPYIKGVHLKAFPLPVLENKQMIVAKLEPLVKEIINKKCKGELNCETEEAMIESLVYKLYGLTEEEIKIVEGCE